MKFLYILNIFIILQVNNLIASESDSSSSDFESEIKNDRKNKCRVCLRKYNRKSNLTRHMKIHKDIKPHRCICCQISFREKHHLKNHQESGICKKNMQVFIEKNDLTIQKVSNFKLNVQEPTDLNEIAMVLASLYKLN